MMPTPRLPKPRATGLPSHKRRELTELLVHATREGPQQTAEETMNENGSAAAPST